VDIAIAVSQLNAKARPVERISLYISKAVRPIRDEARKTAGLWHILVSGLLIVDNEFDKQKKQVTRKWTRSRK